MKSVIMIARSFPPEGNAGAHRALRFVRHLPSLGWQPTVVTLDSTVYERYDPELLTLVSPEITVIRVRNPDPWKGFQQWRSRRLQQKLCGEPTETPRKIGPADQGPLRSSARKLVRRAEACCYHPDMEMGWIRPAVNATLKHCIEDRPDVIWATAGPVSSFAVAQKLSEFTSIPYVLDFRDSWTITYNEFEDTRPSWAQRHEQRRMYRLLERAQSIIFRFNTEAECYWRAYKGALDASKVYIIPNGFEGPIDEFVPPRGDKCEILYTGTVSDYRYDSLLQSLTALNQSSPDLLKQLHLHFVGEGAELLANDAAGLGLDDIITTRGPTSQKEVAKLTKQAHALLILGRPQTKRGYELFAGAKLFGYLKSGLPIIGVLPPDETRTVLRRVGANTVADVNSTSEIIAVIAKVLDAWWQGKLLSLVPNRSACAIYSTAYQIPELVRALEGSPAIDPFAPGGVDMPASLRSEIANRERELGQETSTCVRPEVVSRPTVK